MVRRRETRLELVYWSDQLAPTNGLLDCLPRHFAPTNGLLEGLSSHFAPTTRPVHTFDSPSRRRRGMLSLVGRRPAPSRPGGATSSDAWPRLAPSCTVSPWSGHVGRCWAMLDTACPGREPWTLRIFAKCGQVLHRQAPLVQVGRRGLGGFSQSAAMLDTAGPRLTMLGAAWLRSAPPHAARPRRAPSYTVSTLVRRRSTPLDAVQAVPMPRWTLPCAAPPPPPSFTLPARARPRPAPPRAVPLRPPAPHAATRRPTQGGVGPGGGTPLCKYGCRVDHWTFSGGVSFRLLPLCRKIKNSSEKPSFRGVGLAFLYRGNEKPVVKGTL